ncbi:MAG: hypothetical protein WAT93_04010 [Pontixanthobacter sp.]
MSQPNFQLTCDHLSRSVDDTQFERFRWDRDEAPKLARLIELVTGAFDDRRDIELVEEGGSSGFKRYVLKVHSQRTIAIAVMLKDGFAVLGAEPLDRSPFTVARGDPISTQFDNVDEAWIAGALQNIISRIGKAH